MTGVLDGKSAIVTGAGSGVGRVTALRFAEEGALVVAADIDLDHAKETVRQVESAGGSAVAVEVDVSDEQQVQGMIAAAVDQYGRLDITVRASTGLALVGRAALGKLLGKSLGNAV